MEQSYTQHDSSYSPRIARWSLIAGIILVLNIFFNYAISLVYEAPRYEDFMTDPNTASTIADRPTCLSLGGQWNESVTPFIEGRQKVVTTGYCDPDFTNRKVYEEAQAKYQRTVFIILFILGIISLGVGVMIKHIILTPALAWGGVLSLLIASLRYWSLAGSIFKLVIVGAALGTLIWIAVKKFSR